MMKVAVSGPTVRQIFAQLLSRHLWFEVSAVAASERSIGIEVCRDGNVEISPIPPGTADLASARVAAGLAILDAEHLKVKRHIQM